MSCFHLDVGPSHTPASKLGVLLGGPGAKIHLGLDLALAWVEGHLRGVK